MFPSSQKILATLSRTARVCLRCQTDQCLCDIQLLFQVLGSLQLFCGFFVALPVIGGIFVIIGVVFIVLAVKKTKYERLVWGIGKDYNWSSGNQLFTIHICLSDPNVRWSILFVSLPFVIHLHWFHVPVLRTVAFTKLKLLNWNRNMSNKTKISFDFFIHHSPDPTQQAFNTSLWWDFAGSCWNMFIAIIERLEILCNLICY